MRTNVFREYLCEIKNLAKPFLPHSKWPPGRVFLPLFLPNKLLRRFFFLSIVYVKKPFLLSSFTFKKTVFTKILESWALKLSNLSCHEYLTCFVKICWRRRFRIQEFCLYAGLGLLFGLYAGLLLGLDSVGHLCPMFLPATPVRQGAWSVWYEVLKMQYESLFLNMKQYIQGRV